MNLPYCWYLNGVENWLNQEDNKLRNLEKDSDACILEAEVDNFKLEKVIAWGNKTEKTFKSKSATGEFSGLVAIDWQVWHQAQGIPPGK